MGPPRGRSGGFRGRGDGGGRGRGGGRFGGRGSAMKVRGGGRGGRGFGGRGRGGGGGGRGGGTKGGSKGVIEPHRHEGVFFSKGKDDFVLTKNLVPGESVYNEKRISVQVNFLPLFLCSLFGLFDLKNCLWIYIC